MPEYNARRNVFHTLDISGLPRDAHRGLLLDRFLLKAGRTGESESISKNKLLQEVAGRSFDQVREPVYGDAFDRWSRHWLLQPQARCLQARTCSRMAIGLGAKGVIDAGVRLHATYGVPLIPGSTIKGAVAAWCDARYAGAEPPIRDAWEQSGALPPVWFGGRRAQGDIQALPPGDSYALLFGTLEQEGAVVFEDAWWVPENLSPCTWTS